jgi:DTW domain-containing protein YfiP
VAQISGSPRNKECKFCKEPFKCICMHLPAVSSAVFWF